MPFTLPSLSHCYTFSWTTLWSKPCISVVPFVRVTKSLNYTSACMQHSSKTNNLSSKTWAPFKQSRAHGLKSMAQVHFRFHLHFLVMLRRDDKEMRKRCCINPPACFCILCEMDTLHFNGPLDWCLSVFHQQQIIGVMCCTVSGPLKGNLQIGNSNKKTERAPGCQTFCHTLTVNSNLLLPYRHTEITTRSCSHSN